MMAYAGSMSSEGLKMLAGLGAGDKLAALKKINLAIAVSKMGQVTLEPLAVAMVTSNDAPVRYFGWEAYSSMRTIAIVTGGKPAETMRATLAAQFAKETDPAVIGQMMRMFIFRGTDEIPQPALTDFFKILDAGWVGLCRKVMVANAQTAEAGATAVEAVMSIKRQLGDKMADKAAAQMLVNMAWAAGKAFDQAQAILQTAAKDSDIEFTFSTISKLLVDCENGLNGISQAGNGRINKALTASGDKAANVRLAILDWVADMVKKYEIQQPQDMVQPSK